MMGKSSNYIAATGFNALEQKLQDINGQITAQGEAFTGNWQKLQLCKCVWL